MQINIPEILSHFKCGAASFEGIEPNRAIAEIQHWDELHKILWLRFSEDVPQTDRPFMLKCINKDENLYVILKGSFDSDASALHYIRREYPPFRAFFVTGIMVAKKEDETPEAALKVIHSLNLRPAAVATPVYKKAI